MTCKAVNAMPTLSGRRSLPKAVAPASRSTVQLSVVWRYRIEAAAAERKAEVRLHGTRMAF